MGIATVEPEKIPVISLGPMINEKVLVENKQYHITAVSVGNPHSVIFMDEIDDLELGKIGPSFENLAIFPERVNTEFVKIIDNKTLKMRVWERGSGETYACGTGSCATVVAAILNGHCDYNVPITVKLIGGELTIVCDKDLRVYMTGRATKVYDGVYEYED
jgi:diaminopimelate epimerase